MKNSEFETVGLIDHPDRDGKKCFPLTVENFSELAFIQYSLIKNIQFISEMLVACGDGMITESKAHLGEILKGVSVVALEISDCFYWNSEILDELERNDNKMTFSTKNGAKTTTKKPN